MKNKGNFWGATAILMGNVIGAGIFGLPYVIAKAGFITGLIHLIVLGLAAWILALAYGEVVLRTQEKHQLPGYVGMYLGRKAKRVELISLIFGINGALLAYVLIAGDFLSTVFSPLVSWSGFSWGWIFLAIGAVGIFSGLKIIARVEIVMTILLIVAMLIVAFFGLPHFSLANLTPIDFNNAFLPFGVAMFALIGSPAIPSLVNMMVGRKEKVKKAINVGMFIPQIIYFLFVLIVVGACGAATSADALTGLGQKVGEMAAYIGMVFGVLSMATSFLVLGLVLQEIYRLDYHLPRFWAWFLALAVPAIIFSLQSASFIAVIALVGSITGGVDSILIVLMHKKAQANRGLKPPYSVRLSALGRVSLLLLFTLGIAYELYHLFI